ncbi:MAG TPA: oxidoreductase, partial [Planctomycetaceae bacterium]|nr:oxidoreductase [Planctomycetaceae bacterium]
LEIWKRLAKEWLPADLDGFATEVGLAELSDYVEQILQGQIVGRIVVDLQG